MQTLIYEYKQSLRELKKMKAVIEAKSELLELDIQDKTLINCLISEVAFAIQLMASGQNPDARREEDRTGAYTLDSKLIKAKWSVKRGCSLLMTIGCYMMYWQI